MDDQDAGRTVAVHLTRQLETTLESLGHTVVIWWICSAPDDALVDGLTPIAEILVDDRVYMVGSDGASAWVMPTR